MSDPAFVVIRVRDGTSLPPAARPMQQTADERQWNDFIADYPDAKFSKVFEDDDDPNQAFYEVRLPDRERALKFAKEVRVRLAGIVEEAYLQARIRASRGGGDAAVALSEGQGYFKRASLGIDAPAAWKLFDSSGAGVRLADVESGWAVDHPYLPRGLELVCGLNHHDFDHGVKVLGVLAARHAESEVRGGAPDADVLLASYVRSEESTASVAWAINNALLRLQPGDVLLLEVVTEYLDEQGNVTIPTVPIETQPAVRHAIDRCTRKGVLVIEPAGNSAVNLDPLNLHINRSGALMVGASVVNHEAGTHSWSGPNALSNYGMRVDCFAWGDRIRTLGAMEKAADRYAMFSGTSGASAIIACAAVLVQDFAKRLLEARGRTPAYLEPHELRGYLTHTEDTTHTRDREANPIGVMPNLNRILDRVNADLALPGTRHRTPEADEDRDGRTVRPKRATGRATRTRARATTSVGRTAQSVARATKTKTKRPITAGGARRSSLARARPKTRKK